MGEFYDTTMVLADVAIILLMLLFFLLLGQALMNYFFMSDARIIQEYSSGYLSLANWAPEKMESSALFPKVNHRVNAKTEPAVIDVKLGSSVEGSFAVGFEDKLPLPYTIERDAAERRIVFDYYQEFSTAALNAIKVNKKNEARVAEIEFKIEENKP